MFSPVRSTIQSVEGRLEDLRDQECEKVGVFSSSLLEAAKSLNINRNACLAISFMLDTRIVT